MANSYQLIYDMFQSRATVGKQRFVDWFVGKSLKPIWTYGHDGFGGSASILDAVNEGMQISSDGNFGISFNGKRNFNYEGCVLITICKRTQSADFRVTAGLSNTTSTHTLQGQNNSVWFTNASNISFCRLYSKDGSTETSSDTDIAEDESYHGVKIECGVSDLKLTMDGVLKVTKTINRPAAKLQPMLMAVSGVIAGFQAQYKYCEVYNT